MKQESQLWRRTRTVSLKGEESLCHEVNHGIDQEAATLRRINQVLNTTLELRAVLQRIVIEITHLLSAQGASVILHHDATHEAELTTSYGADTEVRTARYPLAGSLAGWVAKEQRPLRVPRLTAHEWPLVWELAKQFVPEPEPVAVLLVPLRVQGKITGSLEVLWNLGHVITDREEQLLEALADQAALAITNARLFEEKERAVQAAQASEARYRNLFENANDAIITFSLDGILTSVNRGFEVMTGWARGEILGQHYNKVVTPASVALAAERDRRFFAGEKIASLFEADLVGKEGSLIPIEARVRFIRDAAEQPIGMQGIYRDITHRKQVEAAVEEETQIATAFARIGRELISSLDTPVLLQRLCQVTAEVLPADSSYTLLWSPAEEGYVVVAGYGDTPAQEQITQALKIPRTLISDLLTFLECNDVLEVDERACGNAFMAHLAQSYGATQGLWMALRRGKELVGVQTAYSRGATSPFTPRQKQIARGLAQIASMALTNARLLEQAESATHQKSAFLATISHELRTPFNVILGYLDLLHAEEFGPLAAEQADIIHRVQHTTQGLFDLIAALLDASHIEQGNVSLELAAIDVATLLQELRQETENLQPHARLQWRWNLRPETPPLYTDRRKLKVILMHLLRNAMKFTEEGTVTVEASSATGGVEFRITDTGIGIAPEVLPIMFESFRQGDQTTTRRYDGLGLGLYIVRQLVELLGGAVTVDSKQEHGSAFRLWVPQQKSDSRSTPSA
jgi:PAS domain S-box-containing protein